MKRNLIVTYETIIEPLSNETSRQALETLRFIPLVITGLCSIVQSCDFELTLVANFDALDRSPFARAALEFAIHTLRREGVNFIRTVSCDSLCDDDIASQMQQEAGSFFIGSTAQDLHIARRLGIDCILLTTEPIDGAVLNSDSWISVAHYVIGKARYGECSRSTKETSISSEVSLYGTGVCSIATGLGFFDHMLTLLGSHAGFDLTIRASGDLWVDEHHLIEDVGIVLGEAISRALGTRSGIARYGFLLPMDEALAHVAIDLAARTHLEWDASFSREKIGDMPTEMFKHFFKSFAESLRCSLHVRVSGENEHHKIEAIFKGVGRTLRIAVNQDRLSKGIPSTKGVL